MRVYLGRITSDAFFILVLLGLNPAFDIDLRPFLQILGAVFGQLVEGDDVMPFYFLFFIAVLVFPTPGGSDREVANSRDCSSPFLLLFILCKVECSLHVIRLKFSITLFVLLPSI